MIIGETWFNKQQLNLYISGYTAVHSCREGRRGGGLSMYVHERCNIQKYEVNKIRNCESIRIGIINKSRPDETISVFGVYRPPSQSHQQVSDFLLSLEETLEHMTTNKCIIAGDLNIDADKKDYIARKYSNLIKSYDFSICNTLPTRPASKTRIDHVLTNYTRECNHTIFTVANEFSDHNIVIAAIDNTISDCPPAPRKLINYTKMCHELSYMIESHRPVTSDANSLYDFIERAILSSRNLSTTIKQNASSNRRNANPCPWHSNISYKKKDKSGKDTKKRILPTPICAIS